MKQDAYQSLIQILEELVSVYNVFFQTLEDEKLALIAFDLKRIGEINKAKEIFINKTKSMERDRQARTDAFMQNHHLLGKNLSLTQIVNVLPQDQAAKLRGVQVALDITLTRVKDLNKQNELLTQNAIKFVKHSMNTGQEQISRTTYKKQGQLETSNSPGKFVSKEV